MIMNFSDIPVDDLLYPVVKQCETPEELTDFGGEDWYGPAFYVKLDWEGTYAEDNELKGRVNTLVCHADDYISQLRAISDDITGVIDYVEGEKHGEDIL